MHGFNRETQGQQVFHRSARRLFGCFVRSAVRLEAGNGAHRDEGLRLAQQVLTDGLLRRTFEPLFDNGLRGLYTVTPLFQDGRPAGDGQFQGGGPHILQIEELIEDVGPGNPSHPLALLRAGEGTDEDDGHLGMTGAQPREGIQAGVPQHPHVADDELRHLVVIVSEALGEQLDGIPRVLDHTDLEALLREHVAHELAALPQILNEQHLPLKGHRALPRLAPECLTCPRPALSQHLVGSHDRHSIVATGRIQQQSCRSFAPRS